MLGGLPSDYLDTSLAALREVTPESATAAYASVVDAGTASLVVVGAADQLAEPLRALGYDDLVVDPRDWAPRTADLTVGGTTCPSPWRPVSVAALALSISLLVLPEVAVGERLLSGLEGGLRLIQGLGRRRVVRDAERRTATASRTASATASALGLVSPVLAPESPANTWSSASCRVSPIPTC